MANTTKITVASQYWYDLCQEESVLIIIYATHWGSCSGINIKMRTQKYMSRLYVTVVRLPQSHYFPVHSSDVLKMYLKTFLRIPYGHCSVAVCLLTWDQLITFWKEGLFVCLNPLFTYTYHPPQHTTGILVVSYQQNWLSINTILSHVKTDFCI